MSPATEVSLALDAGRDGTGTTPAPTSGSPAWWRREATREAGVLLVAAVLLLRALPPWDLVRNALPWGGEPGAPVVPWVLRHEVLPSGHLSGWTDSWFAGFPAGVFTPALANLVAALAGLVLPFALAFKLVAFGGVLLLPPATWAMARLSALPRVYASVLPVLVLAFLLDTTPRAGNVGGALAGDYDLALGLGLGVVALGLADRLMRTGRGVVALGLVAGAAGLSHPAVAGWVLVGSVVVLVLNRVWHAREQLLIAVGTLGSACLVGAWWWVPYVRLHAWTTASGVPRPTSSAALLLPGSWWWEYPTLALALAGGWLGVSRRRPVPSALAAMTVVAAVCAVKLPVDVVDFSQVSSLWFLGRWLLVGTAVAEIALLLRGSSLAESNPPVLHRVPQLAGPLALVLVASTLALVWGWVPGTVIRSATLSEDGRARLLGISVPVTRQSAYGGPVLAGYEHRADGRELASLQKMLRQVGQRDGCGRVAWDNASVHAVSQDSPFGDDRVLQRLPLWTNGCLDTLSGSAYGSSATTTEILLAESLTSTVRDQWKIGLPYHRASVNLGLVRLKMLGVRYFLTHGGPIEEQVGQNQVVHRVDSGAGWTVWQLDDAAVVQPLSSLPAVLVQDSGVRALPVTGAAYSETTTFYDYPLADSGPADWPRVPFGAVIAPIEVRRPATVTAVDVSSTRVSFDVAAAGSPVVVRVSDFPGWEVTGGSAHRVTPNLLVVVPSATHVVLKRPEGTPGGALPLAASAFGLLLIGALGLVSRRSRSGGRGAAGSTQAVD